MTKKAQDILKTVKLKKFTQKYNETEEATYWEADLTKELDCIFSVPAETEAEALELLAEQVEYRLNAPKLTTVADIALEG